MRRMLAALFGLCAWVVVGGGVAVAQPSQNLDDYVLFAADRIHLKDLATVTSGDVGVNNPVNLALVFGPGDVFANGTTVVGNAMRGDRITFDDLYANRVLTSATGITVNGVGPLPTGTLPLIDPMPALPAFAPGLGTFVVGGDVTLPPGAYGNVMVQAGKRLHLIAGTYEMRNLQTGRNAIIVADGPVTVNISGNLKLGNGSTIGAGAALLAGDAVFNVGGHTVRFGAQTIAKMMLYAPNARLAFGRSFRGIGQFVGRSINTDHSTNFSRGDCGNGIVEQGEQCEPPNVGSCDANCQLPPPPTTTSSSTTTTSTSTTSSSSSTTTSASSTSSTSTSSSTTTSSSAPTTSSSSSSTTTTTAPTTSTSSSTTTSSSAPTTSSSSSSSTTTTSSSSTSSTSSTAPPTTTSSSSSTSSSSTTTSTSTSSTSSSTSTSTTTTSTSTTTLQTSTTSIPQPTTTTTSTTMPVAICGNNELEPGEECDPPGSSCPPDGTCGDDCVCIFGGGS